MICYISRSSSCPVVVPSSRGGATRAPGVYLSELLEHLNTRRCREALRRRRGRGPAKHNHHTIFSNSHKEVEQGRPSPNNNNTCSIDDNTLVTPQRDDKQPLHQQVTLGAEPRVTPPGVSRAAESTQHEVVGASAKREGSQLAKRRVPIRRTHSRKGHGAKGRGSSLKVKVGPEAAHRRSSLEDRLPVVTPSPPGSIYPSGNIRVVVRRTKRGGTSYRRSKTNKVYRSHLPGRSVPTRGVCAAAGTLASAQHVSVSGALVPLCPSSSTATCSSPRPALATTTTWCHRRLCRGQQQRQFLSQSTAVPLQEQITPFRDRVSQHATTAVATEHQQRHVCSLSESHKGAGVLVLTPKEKRAIVGYFYKKNIINFLSGENSEEVLDNSATSGKVLSNQEVTRRNLVSAPRSVLPTKVSPTSVVMANETEQQQNMANNQQTGDVKQMKGYRKKGLVNEKVLLERLSDMSIEDDALAPVIVLSSVEDHDDASPMEEESEPTKTSGKKKGNIKLQASLSLDVPCLNVMDEPKRPPM